MVQRGIFLLWNVVKMLTFAGWSVGIFFTGNIKLDNNRMGTMKSAAAWHSSNSRTMLKGYRFSFPVLFGDTLRWRNTIWIARQKEDQLTIPTSLCSTRKIGCRSCAVGIPIRHLPCLTPKPTRSRLQFHHRSGLARGRACDLGVLAEVFLITFTIVHALGNFVDMLGGRAPTCPEHWRVLELPVRTLRLLWSSMNGDGCSGSKTRLT